MHRIVKAVLGTAVAAALVGGAAAGGGTSAVAAPATSSVGGKISQAEIITRLNDWTNKVKPPYSQSGHRWDYGHTREYRTDCSGLADMALHLSTDDWTGKPKKSESAGSFTTDTKFVHERNMDSGNRGTFTPSTIHTGDVFDDVVDGHAWVFGYWESGGKTFTYYNFGGGSSGTAPPEVHHGARMTDNDLGYENSNNYEVWRYKNVVA